MPLVTPREMSEHRLHREACGLAMAVQRLVDGVRLPRLIVRQ